MMESDQKQQSRLVATPIIAGLVAAFLLAIQALSFSHVHGDPDHHADPADMAAEQCELCFVAAHASGDVPTPITHSAVAASTQFDASILTGQWSPPAPVSQGSRAPPFPQF